MIFGFGVNWALLIKTALGGAGDSDYENDSAEEAGDKDMDDDSFMESYTDALNEELSKTSIKQTFSRAQHHTNNEVNCFC